MPTSRVPPYLLPVEAVEPRPTRIAPGSREDVGTFTWTLAHGAGILSRTEPLKLFLTLGRHRPLFRAWLKFAGRLMPRGRLPRRETELVILRIGFLRACRYDLEQHVHLSRRSGVRDEDLARIPQGPDAPGWSPREAAILAAVDELQAQRDISDATWARLREHLDEQDAIELVLLAGHYDLLATTIITLGIQPDAPRGGGRRR
jgi:alkylhydroperoxidase family enzyme